MPSKSVTNKNRSRRGFPNRMHALISLPVLLLIMLKQRDVKLCSEHCSITSTCKTV